MSNLFIGIVSAKPDGLGELSSSSYRYMDEMIAWAKGGGYDTWLFTDEAGPLHGDDIKAFIKGENAGIAEDPQGAHGIHNRRCVFVYFCGHGFTRGRYDQFWVLSRGRHDWEDRIDVMAMKDVLEHYQPGHIRIFGDACAEAKDLSGGGSAVFPNPAHIPDAENVRTDLFFASSKGATTLADSKGPLFSQVVRKAILDTPIPDAAIDKMISDHTGQATITNRSLRNFVEPRFKNFVASKNGVAVPWIIPDVDYPESIYRQEGPAQTPPGAPPQLATEDLSAAQAEVDEWESALRSSSDMMSGHGVSRGDRTVMFTDQRAFDSPTRGYENPRSFPQHKEDPDTAHIGFRWGADGIDEYNGTAIIRMNETSFLVPEFREFTTVLAVKRVDATKIDISISALKPVGDPDARLHTYGGVLLKRLISGDSDYNVLSIIANYARERVHEDPLVSMALAYFYDAIGRRGSIREMLGEIHARQGAVAMDIALLANQPISYDPVERTLVAGDIPLATQLPVLSRGWSQLFSGQHPAIFSELEPLRRSIGAEAHAVFADSRDHLRIDRWLKANFTRVPDPEPAFAYKAQ